MPRAHPDEHYTEQHCSAKAKRSWRFLFRVSVLEWICLLAGLMLVFRYRWILDDSTIYYRYVDNFLFLKRGLVFNQGEYVEGFSSPLWMLLLIALRTTRLDYWTITLLVACFAWVAFWMAAVHVNRKLCSQLSVSAINMPLILLSTAYGPLTYFTSGSEAPLMQLAAACVALHAIQPRTITWQVLLGLLPLVRNEFIVPLCVLIALRLVMSRRVPWALIISSVSFGLSWMLFRVYYYADCFPNTFYLKDKTAVAQGLYYLWNSFGPYGLWIFLTFSVPALVFLSRKRYALGIGARGVMALTGASSLIYVVRVGGDMMHYRFVAFSFCVFALCSGGIAEVSCFHWRLLPSDASRLLAGLTVGVLSFSIYPPFLSQHPVWGREQRTLDRGISDAPWHRHHPALEFSSQRRLEDKQRLSRYSTMKPGHTGITTDVFCATMFSDPATRYVHGYGLTDAILARVDTPEERPGHKARLSALAVDLVKLRSWDNRTQAGLALRAVSENRGPRWMQNNLVTLSGIERRMYNQHNLYANSLLCLKDVGRIHL